MQKETEVKPSYELKLHKVKIGVTRANWRRQTEEFEIAVADPLPRMRQKIPTVSKYLQNSAVKCPALLSLI